MKTTTCVVVGVLILSSAALTQQRSSRANDEAAFKALEDKWAAPLLNADANALAGILAPIQ